MTAAGRMNRYHRGGFRRPEGGVGIERTEAVIAARRRQVAVKVPGGRGVTPTGEVRLNGLTVREEALGVRSKKIVFFGGRRAYRLLGPAAWPLSCRKGASRGLLGLEGLIFVVWVWFGAGGLEA